MTTVIYKPIGQDGYEFCHPVNENDFKEISEEIDGSPRQAHWKPIEMQLITYDEGKSLKRSDAPWLGSDSLIFRPKAVMALSGILKKYGELLPLACGREKLVIYNPTRISGALDIAKSDLSRFDNGDIMYIRRHVFHPEIVSNIHAFKITNLRVSPTFVSKAFVDAWHAYELVGLDFVEVWRG